MADDEPFWHRGAWRVSVCCDGMIAPGDYVVYDLDGEIVHEVCVRGR